MQQTSKPRQQNEQQQQNKRRETNNNQSQNQQQLLLQQQQQIFDSLDPEQQKFLAVIQKIKIGQQQYFEVKYQVNLFQINIQQNEELANQITEQMERNKSLEEEHKQNLLHIETLNMMTKYQLVFVKLETLMHKILQNIDARKKMRIKKAFQAFRFNSQGQRQQEKKLQQKKRLVLLKFQNTLTNFCEAMQRYTNRAHVQAAFREMKLRYEAYKQEEVIKQKNRKKVQELQQELVLTIKKLESVNGKQIEIESEFENTKRKISDQQRYMKELEDRGIHLNNEYIQLLERQNSGSQERVNVQGLEEKIYGLETQISEFESDNRSLKDRLDGTNTHVGSFIREMSSFLDTHEIQGIINMEVESEEEEEVDRMVDLEYDEVRPHAGTGGSSKMKSRPNQQNQQQMSGIAGRAQMIQDHQNTAGGSQSQQQNAQRRTQQQQNTIQNRMMAQIISGNNSQAAQSLQQRQPSNQAPAQQQQKISSNYNSNRVNR
eukprot:403347531